MRYLGISIPKRKSFNSKNASSLQRFHGTQAHTSVNELINHGAKHVWHFRFMPHLLLFLKGRELLNSPSVFQAANRLSTINGKAAKSQTYLGSDERFRLFTFNITLVPTQDL